MKTISPVTLDWLTQRLVEVADKAKEKDLRVELSALNSLARLHRIQGRGDRSAVPERLTVHFVHPPTLSVDDPTIPSEAFNPLIAGPVQDIIWGPGQREELGGGAGADPESAD